MACIPTRMGIEFFADTTKLFCRSLMQALFFWYRACTAAAVYSYIIIAHIPVSLLISEASPAGFCLPLAQAHQQLGGRQFTFVRKASTFLGEYFRKHSINVSVAVESLENVH